MGPNVAKLFEYLLENPAGVIRRELGTAGIWMGNAGMLSRLHKRGLLEVKITTPVMIRGKIVEARVYTMTEEGKTCLQAYRLRHSSASSSKCATAPNGPGSATCGQQQKSSPAQATTTSQSPI